MTLKICTPALKLVTFALLLSLSFNTAKAAAPYYYQLKIYHLKGKAQAAVVDDYLQNAYLPALHRAGVSSVGVFKPVVADTTEQLIYVFIPFKKGSEFFDLDATLAKDQQYQTAGKTYIEAPHTNPPYLRLENVLMRALRAVPEFHIPKLNAAKNDRVYELRSYESATETAGLNKINMFNDDEIGIFTRLNFNAIFYGQVIAGSHMPNLMYLTAYESKADRDKHWSDFGPEYKKISTLPKYINNVTKNAIVFVRPTDYSDI